VRLPPAAFAGGHAVPVAERNHERSAARRHGASFLARRAVEGLVETAEAPAATGAQLFRRIADAADDLVERHPGIGAVAGAVGGILATARAASSLPPADLREVIERRARAAVDDHSRAEATIAELLRERLAGGVVVTHSASATVGAALLAARPDKVVCTIAKPGEEGRAFAAELRADGLEVELVRDDEAAHALGGASVLLVGADTVFRDGAVLNKVGTLPLAAAAADRGIPTVVACELVKLAPLASADPPELPRETRRLVDLTPPELVSEIVTEQGSFAPGELGALVDRMPLLQEGYGLLGLGPRSPRHAVKSRASAFAQACLRTPGRLLAGLRHPLAIALVGALLASWLIPAITNQWSDRQKERQFKRDLIALIDGSVTRMVTEARLLGLQQEARRPGRSLTAATAESSGVYDRLRSQWLVQRGAIKSILVAYFPDEKFELDWLNIADEVEDFALLASPYADLRFRQDVRSTLSSTFDLTVSQDEITGYSSDPRARDGPAPAGTASWYFAMSRKLLDHKEQLVERILRSHPSGFSAGPRDLARDLFTF
jgi:translation initiation factor 2B subunit (eIF-2B alpha/beta/delta family)